MEEPQQIQFINYTYSFQHLLPLSLIVDDLFVL